MNTILKSKKAIINKVFNDAAKNRRAALVSYIAAGDPDCTRCIEVVDALVAGGADIIELGLPFSDPLADGEANQLAAARALDAGTTPLKVLDLVAEVKKKYPALPLVLYTYMNPLAYSIGLEQFCKRAAEAGVDALLPLDMPPEESGDYRKIIDDAGLPVVVLVAPTTDENRIKKIVRSANAFIYYVCREGVTGERSEFADGVTERINLIKKYTKLPVVVGFGISTPDHIRAAAATGVDGIVVGSSIVRKVEAFAKEQASLNELTSFVSSLRNALT